MASKNPMTYVLGARCKDGVVLVSDRKVTYEDATFDYEDKIIQPFSVTPRGGIVWTAAGREDLYNSFNNRVTVQLRKKGASNIDEFLIIVEEVFERELVSKVYGSRIRTDLEVLIAHNITGDGQAELYLIKGVGSPKHIQNYKAIGQGQPYGSIFLKQIFREKRKLTMEEVANIGCFIIKHIEYFELDKSVGVGEEKPQVYFIPDIPSGSSSNNTEYKPYQANEDMLTKFESNAEENIKKYKDSLDGLFK